MYSTTIERCFMIEASGVHRLEALTRQAVGHVPPLACTVGPRGFLKEASTCRIEAFFDVRIQDIFSFIANGCENSYDVILIVSNWSKAQAGRCQASFTVR